MQGECDCLAMRCDQSTKMEGGLLFKMLLVCVFVCQVGIHSDSRIRTDQSYHHQGQIGKGSVDPS